MLHRKVCFRIRRSLIGMFLLLSCFILFCPLSSYAALGLEKKQFALLMERLVQDGFDRKYIEKIYSSRMVHLETKGISLFSVHREAKLDYGQYLSGSNIWKAKSYLRRHKEALQNAEKEFGVEKEVITAVILVETRLGVSLGNSSILNTLSTMAILSDLKSRDFVWKRMLKSEEHNKTDFNAWAERKTEWAYQELKAFLEYTRKENMDPLTVNGSYAGAMGIGQFMPSNVLKLAMDGNKDGHIDLFNHADAIYSIANYLRAHGWKPGIGRETKYQVLLRYNYSRYYVDTLLTIAEQLKG